jgi:hypothetical protein
LALKLCEFAKALQDTQICQELDILMGLSGEICLLPLFRHLLLFPKAYQHFQLHL